MVDRMIPLTPAVRCKQCHRARQTVRDQRVLGTAYTGQYAQHVVLYMQENTMLL